MNVNVQQQRVTNGDADDGDCIREAQWNIPLCMIQSEQTAKRDDQIARVPADHADTKAKQQPLNRDHAEPLLEQEIPHPQREHRAQAVTD